MTTDWDHRCPSIVTCGWTGRILDSDQAGGDRRTKAHCQLVIDHQTIESVTIVLLLPLTESNSLYALEISLEATKDSPAADLCAKMYREKEPVREAFGSVLEIVMRTNRRLLLYSSEQM